MRIGINSGAASGPETTVAGLIARAQKMEQLGFDTFWMANMFGLDAMTALALVGQATQRIKLGTAVVPSYPRHPLVMAQRRRLPTPRPAAALRSVSGSPTSPSSRVCSGCPMRTRRAT